MKEKIIFWFVFFGLALTACTKGSAEAQIEKPEYEITIPESSNIGNFINIRFKANKKIEKASAVFINNKNTPVQKLDAFPINKEQTEFVVVAGIATWWQPSEWQIKAQIVFKDKKLKNEIFEETKPFTIHDTEYPKYIMKFNKKNTDLIYKKSEKKTEQKNRFAEVIKAKDPKAILFPGPFVLPFKVTRISSPFGEKRISKYTNGKVTERRHWGVDYPAPTGTVVSAPCGGKVVLAESRIVTGNTIVLEHFPGVYTIYYHLHKIYVKEGVVLNQGAKLGEVGTTGFSTGPHLHWELRINEIPIDPRHLLKKNLY